MRQFVTDHIVALGEIDEELTVAVAIEHLRTIPHRVVEINAIVDGGQERHSGIVN